MTDDLNVQERLDREEQERGMLDNMALACTTLETIHAEAIEGSARMADILVEICRRAAELLEEAHDYCRYGRKPSEVEEATHVEV